MYRTAKHELLMSGSIENKSIYDLPGVGKVRGGRLEEVGIRTAGQLLSLYKRMRRDEFESFLNQTCGRNSMWAGMTIAALEEYKQTNVPFTLPLKKNTMLEKSIPSELSISLEKKIPLEKSILSSNALQKAPVSNEKSRLFDHLSLYCRKTISIPA